MDHRSDPDLRAQRRALIKAAHPDLGGDPDRLMAVLAEFDTGTPPPEQPAPIVSTRRHRVLTARLRSVVRDLRTTLPRRCPGSIRFIDISH